MPIHHGLLGWIVLGLIAGILARLIVPGRDPGGVVVTILVGIAGALLAGCVARALGWAPPSSMWAGYAAAAAGAVALLALYRLVMARRAH